MTKPKINEVVHDFATTENLIYELAKQPYTTGVHRSTTVDTIISRCRDYVNGVIHKAAAIATPAGKSTPAAPKPGNPGGHRGNYNMQKK